jgi:subtilase family serine protease
MKIRDVYSSYLLTFGISAFLLGIGNWIVGGFESAKYQAMLHKTIQTGLEESYRNFQQLDHQKNEEVLRRINQDRERYNAARVKLDFYYVVLTGGRWLLAIGTVAIVAAVIGLIRRDTQIKMKKIGAVIRKEST